MFKSFIKKSRKTLCLLPGILSIEHNVENNLVDDSTDYDAENEKDRKYVKLKK